MLLGRPVVASQVPSLHGLIADGVSGFCVPPGDKVSLARRTRQIFLEPALAEHLGAPHTGACWTISPPASLSSACQRTYAEVA